MGGLKIGLDVVNTGGRVGLIVGGIKNSLVAGAESISSMKNKKAIL